MEPISPEPAGLPDFLTIDSFESASNLALLAVYDAAINPIAKTFTVTPSQRAPDYHFPLTQLYPNVLQIVGYGWTPNFWADIKLTHPFPGSGIDAFDPRVIAILPANPGVSFNYPIFNCIGNNSVVVEPDGYTKLFDNLGGSIPGNTNPFKAYFKDQPYRIWSSTGVTSETQRWNLNLAGFGGPMQFKLVVDVSTNYSNPSQPIVDNAPEPVETSTTISTGLTPDGGTAFVEVTLLDWQGASNTECKVECPPLFNSAIQLFYSHSGPNPNEYIFSGTISNALLAPEGEYDVLITAWDTPTDIHIFDEAIALVDDDIAFNPIDVTAPWLNFSPYDVFVEGNYAYIAGGINGFHIFDISKPLEPTWINRVEITNETTDVYVSNGYAYVINTTGYSSGDILYIIDIDPPESAAIVSLVRLYIANGVFVSGGYAYIADFDGLLIIDIDPVESAYIVRTIAGPITSALGVYVTSGYAYVIDFDNKFHIVDVDPVESAQVVKTVVTDAYGYDVCVSDGYAYLVMGYYGVRVIDVEPYDEAHMIKTIETPEQALDVKVSDGNAYVANAEAGLVILDINPPESTSILKIVDTPGYIKAVSISGEYAYVANLYAGLQIIDITPPETSFLAKSIDTAGYPTDIHVSDDYAYVTNRYVGLHIFNINPPESTSLVKSLSLTMPYETNGVFVSSGYAYVTLSYFGLQIIDIDPLETAYLVKAIVLPGVNNDVHVSNGYAYVANSADGIHIIDIDPPESAYVVKTVADGSYGAYDVQVSHGYAYFVYGSLYIADIEPLESAYIIKRVPDSRDASEVYISNGYAYTTGNNSIYSFQITDIDPPGSAHVIKTFSQDNGAHDVCVSNGYAYVTSDHRDLCIYDINPPELASLLKTIPIPGYVGQVIVLDGYAYVGYYGGLCIIKLW